MNTVAWFGVRHSIITLSLWLNYGYICLGQPNKVQPNTPVQTVKFIKTSFRRLLYNNQFCLAHELYMHVLFTVIAFFSLLKVSLRLPSCPYSMHLLHFRCNFYTIAAIDCEFFSFLFEVYARKYCYSLGWFMMKN